jgi:hypothetical protein
MPEPLAEEVATAPGGDAPADGAPGAAQAQAERGHGTDWVFYGLGLSLQTVLWCLLFLAIIVAVAVGGHLTEFRYVGF